MPKATLYLFIGYPGAGKTRVAKIIAKKTGAFHIWADIERNKLFPNPTHSKEESDELYLKLNASASYLLSDKRSVVFDTNFNYKQDRDKLRQIAKINKADTVLIWINTPKEIAKDRAVNSGKTRNNYNYNMSAKDFDNIASKLEPPEKSEGAIELDATNLDEKEVLSKLGL